MSKNLPKIYTKLPKSGYQTAYGYMHRDLALLFNLLLLYWQKCCVKQRQNSLHVHPRLKVLTISFKVLRKNVRGTEENEVKNENTENKM